ncbi:MAG TPA: helix-turn-helix domain-containing protein [Thermoanaerobaculia bacterium]
MKDLRDLNVVFLLLRLRSGKTQAQVAAEAKVAPTAVQKAERRGRGGRAGVNVGTVDALLTYYAADLILVARLLRKARQHLGGLETIRGVGDLTEDVAAKIWAEIDEEDPPPA